MKKQNFFLAISTIVLLFMICSCTHKYFPLNELYSAMMPNLVPGDIIVFEKEKAYERGDIIVYMRDGYAETFRIVGLPGDSIGVNNHICIINGKENHSHILSDSIIDIDDVSGHVKIDIIEEVLPNSLALKVYRFPVIKSSIDEAPASIKPIYIPKGYYFVLGDFRSIAADSRTIGLIPYDEIKGKMVKIIK